MSSRQVKRITVPFTEEGLKEAADWLLAYKEKMLKNIDTLLAKMLNEGEQYALNELGHVDTGETLSTIAAYREGNHGILLVGGNAIWIEFGTGVFFNGEGYPHPKAQELGMNAIGTYIAPYPLNKSGEPHGDNPNGWWYEDPPGSGEYKHTQGIEANMFFYRTGQMLRDKYAEWAKEIFK